jgi:hypothetical protein
MGTSEPMAPSHVYSYTQDAAWYVGFGGLAVIHLTEHVDGQLAHLVEVQATNGQQTSRLTLTTTQAIVLADALLAAGLYDHPGPRSRYETEARP